MVSKNIQIVEKENNAMEILQKSPFFVDIDKKIRAGEDIGKIASWLRKEREFTEYTRPRVIIILNQYREICELSQTENSLRIKSKYFDKDDILSGQLALISSLEIRLSWRYNIEREEYDQWEASGRSEEMRPRFCYKDTALISDQLGREYQRYIEMIKLINNQDKKQMKVPSVEEVEQLVKTLTPADINRLREEDFSDVN
jgi:hypothetical protein